METCSALRLLTNDNEWQDAIRENARSAMPFQLRQLFIYIITNCQVSDPLKLWSDNWRCLSDYILYKRRKLLNDPNFQMSDDDIKNFALGEIEKLLNEIGKTLHNFPTMPFPEASYLGNVQNRLIVEEISYNSGEMKIEHDKLYSNLNMEQQRVYDSVITNVNSKKGGIFFVHGSGGSSQYLKERAILTPTNVVVDDINMRVLDKLLGKIYTYLSTDSIIDPPSGEDDDAEASFPAEYLNSLNMAGIPKHHLELKEGSVVMLLRNLSQINGLCNGTRMIITKCNKNTVECQILCGSHVGTTHLIPRIDMAPSDKKWPIKFTRRQLSLQICFAMTINKSQGQSLETVGLYLPTPIFTHGQLYVAVSRVTSSKGLHILICSERGGTTNITKNIVYEEVFYNLQ